tara:strand:+ start:1131 stop:1322 length:192 start_codon:yes stop_codon:yes gene_type:complete
MSIPTTEEINQLADRYLDGKSGTDEGTKILSKISDSIDLIMSDMDETVAELDRCLDEINKLIG